jgi:hypothetical protein
LAKVLFYSVAIVARKELMNGNSSTARLRRTWVVVMKACPFMLDISCAIVLDDKMPHVLNVTKSALDLCSNFNPLSHCKLRASSDILSRTGGKDDLEINASQ